MNNDIIKKKNRSNTKLPIIKKSNSSTAIIIAALIIALAILLLKSPIEIVAVGNFPNSTSNNTIGVTNNDIFFEIAKGEIEGHSAFFKFGANPAVGSTEEVVWDGSGEYVFLETAQRLSIYSSDNGDSGITNSSGAWDLIVSGLDEDYNEISEYIILDGTTPVITDNFFLRTFRMQIVHSGNPSLTGNSNEGTIIAETLVGGIDQAIILPENGQTLMALYTVPLGKTAYVTGITVALGEGKQAVVKAKVRQCTQIQCSFANKYSLDIYQQAFFGPLKVFFSIPEKTDVAFTASSSSAGTSVSASFGLILVDNE